MARQPEWHVEVLPGLEEAAADELAALAGAAPPAVRSPGEGVLRATGIPQAVIESARRVVAVFLVVPVAVPRPRGLLGHQHLTRIAREAERSRPGAGSTACASWPRAPARRS